MELTCTACCRTVNYGSEESFIWTFRKGDEEAKPGVNTVIRCSTCIPINHTINLSPTCVECDTPVLTCKYTPHNTLDKCGHCFNLPFIYFSNVTHKPMCSEVCYNKHKKMAFETEGLACKYRCSYCNSYKDSMPMCKGCKWDRYCNVDCQRRDWQRHRLECNKK